MNPTAWNFALLSTAAVINRGNDALIVFDLLDIDNDGSTGEHVPRDYFMGDEANLPNPGVTESSEVLIPLTGGPVPPVSPPDQGLGGNVSGTAANSVTCDIGTYEYRYDYGQPAQ